MKMRIPFEQLKRIPLRHLLGVELNDGMMENRPDLHDETINHRLLCGEGEFDVPGFINVLYDMGYRGAWGIEVLNAEVREWPMHKIMERSFKTTKAQFDAAARG